MSGIVVAGASGHARLLIEAIEREGKYRIVGLLDSFKKPGPTPLGYDILGPIEELPALAAQYEIEGGIIGIGDNWVRARIAFQILELAPGFPFVSVVHPAAVLSVRASIGQGSILMAGAAVNPGCGVHNHCFISTHASLDHDGMMEDFSSLGPNTVTGGNVRIGAYSAVGIGAAVIHGITIGPHTVVGAGATVLGDLPDHSVAYGTPARVIRSRAEGEKYL